MAKCKRHPSVETNLLCSKCEDPICPKCMIQTPVGARCPSCARVSRPPVYQVSGKYYLRAIGAGAGLAVAIGLMWAILRVIAFFGFFSFLFGAAAGFAIGEGISLVVNRKRGNSLAVIVGVAVFISYLVSIFVPWGRSFSFFDIIAVIIGIIVGITRVR